ncbi:MAG: Yae1 family protein [Oscillospiraceae bacterium]|jgi:hypothetical protein|nr:Yae1 family protein [Oscillospiraceae bacterium]
MGLAAHVARLGAAVLWLLGTLGMRKLRGKCQNNWWALLYAIIGSAIMCGVTVFFYRVFFGDLVSVSPLFVFLFFVYFWFNMLRKSVEAPAKNDVKQLQASEDDQKAHEESPATIPPERKSEKQNPPLTLKIRIPRKTLKIIAAVLVIVLAFAAGHLVPGGLFVAPPPTPVSTTKVPKKTPVPYTDVSPDQWTGALKIGYERGLKDGREEMRVEAMDRVTRGYDFGYDQGYDQGYLEGFRAGYKFEAE